MSSPHQELICGPVRFAIALAGFLSLAVISVPAAPQAGELAKLSYIKVLKGSVPEYLAVTVDASGAASYDGRKIDEAPTPHSFKLSDATTRRLFSLAQSLGYFESGDLESHKKVANLGVKTFTYERQGKKTQVEFNYTLQREAQELTDLFERIASVEQHILTLEYSIKYDHLNLPNQLRQVQIDLDKKALADPELLTPTLEKIVRGSRFLHLAHVRAQSILDRIQNSN
jgi:hypothetical protein